MKKNSFQNIKQHWWTSMYMNDSLVSYRDNDCLNVNAKIFAWLITTTRLLKATGLHDIRCNDNWRLYVKCWQGINPHRKAKLVAKPAWYKRLSDMWDVGRGQEEMSDTASTLWFDTSATLHSSCKQAQCHKRCPSDPIFSPTRNSSLYFSKIFIEI